MFSRVLVICLGRNRSVILFKEFQLGSVCFHVFQGIAQ